MEKGNGDDEKEQSEAVYRPGVHRDFAQVAIWQDGVVSQAGRFDTTPEQVRMFADSLTCSDKVALEATGNTWAIVTVLGCRAGRVVFNPAKTRALAEAKVKTDKGRRRRDSRRARAHRAAADPVEEPGSGDLAPQPDPRSGGGPASPCRSRPTRCPPRPSW